MFLPHSIGHDPANDGPLSRHVEAVTAPKSTSHRGALYRELEDAAESLEHIGALIRAAYPRTSQMMLAAAQRHRAVLAAHAETTP